MQPQADYRNRTDMWVLCDCKGTRLPDMSTTFLPQASLHYTALPGCPTCKQNGGTKELKETQRECFLKRESCNIYQVSGQPRHSFR